MRIRLLSLALLVSVTARQASTQGLCSAPEHPASFHDSLRAGGYTLTLVATEGTKRGERVSGQLWLWRTSPRDSSTRTGKVAVKVDTAAAPFYGATDLQFAVVAAPVYSDGSEAEPAPDSRDPVYPGVLVLAGNPHDSMAALATLLISTVSNRRDGVWTLDGAGIALRIRSSGGQLKGDWKEWGIVYNGRGYFCLAPRR